MPDPVDMNQPPPAPSPEPGTSAKSTSTGLPANVAAAIACIPLIGGIIFYILEKQDNFVRFYAMQSIIFGCAWFLFNIVSAVVHAVFSAIPGIGGTQRLTRAVGKSKAMDLCLTGRMMDAAEAERSGLVSRVVPAEKLMDEALAVAEKIAAMSTAESKKNRRSSAFAEGYSVINRPPLQPEKFHCYFGQDQFVIELRGHQLQIRVETGLHCVD